MKTVKFICKNCNKTIQVPESWASDVPKACTGKKCKTSFKLNPEALLIEKSSPIVKVEKLDNKKRSRRNEE